MKRKIKHITPPKLKNAVKLTALQLNGIKCDVARSVLTPDVLARLAKAAAATTPAT